MSQKIPLEGLVRKRGRRRNQGLINELTDPAQKL